MELAVKMPSGPCIGWAESWCPFENGFTLEKAPSYRGSQNIADTLEEIFKLQSNWTPHDPISPGFTIFGFSTAKACISRKPRE